MKRLIVLMLLPLMLLTSCATYYTEEDLEEARWEGYEEGYQEGHDDGYSDGYDEGESDYNCLIDDLKTETDPYLAEQLLEAASDVNAWLDDFPHSIDEELEKRVFNLIDQAHDAADILSEVNDLID